MMADIKSINRFISNVKEAYETVEKYKQITEKEISEMVESVNNETNELEKQLKEKYDNYVKKSIKSISASAKDTISPIIAKYNTLYNKTNATIVIQKDDKNLQALIRILEETISEFNSKINEINELEIVSKIPEFKIEQDSFSFNVDNNGTNSKYDASSNSMQCNDAEIKKNISEKLVVEIFSLEKDIEGICNLLETEYSKQYDLAEGVEVLENGKLKTIEEEKTRLSKALENIINENISGEDINNKYDGFFKNLDAISNDAIPNLAFGANDFKQNILLGKTKINVSEEKGFNDVINKSSVLSKRIDKSNNMEIPFLIDLKEKGNILIETYSDVYSQTICDFVYQIIISFLMSFPVERFNLKMLDINDRCGLSTLSVLRKINSKVLKDGIVRDINKLDDFLNEAKRIKYETEDKLGAEGISDIFEYNRKFETSPIDVYLLVIVDFPYGFSTERANILRDIMLNGKKDGVFTLLINNNTITIENHRFDKVEYNKFLDKLVTSSYYFDDDLTFINDDNKKFKFEPNKEVSMSQINNIVENLKKKSDESLVKPIMIDDMFKFIDNDVESDISRELEIPFGNCGGDIQTLLLTNESSPHAALIGTSGSGKSVLFHTLILDACYKYSPDELNFYLLDFKGTEFNYYKNNKLPHISVIGITKDMNDGLSLLENIKNIIYNRQSEFKKVGISDIEEYYKTGKKVPRIFVIIDEIQEIFRIEKICEKALETLSEILAIGRSFGVNVLWASHNVPTVPGIDAKVMNNIRNRICLKVANTNDAIKMFDNLSALKSIENLNRPGIKGLGVIKDERTGSEVQEFRVAYSGDNEQRKKYNILINKKWKDIQHNNLFIVGDDFVPDKYSNNLFNNYLYRSNISSKSFEHYRISLGIDFISGNNFDLIVENTKDNQNILILGNDNDLIRDLMGFTTLSLLINNVTDENCYVDDLPKIYCANKETFNPKYANDLYNYLPKKCSLIQNINTIDKLSECINHVYDVYKERRKSFENQQLPEKYYPIYIIINSIHQLEDIFEEDDALNKTGGFISFDSAFEKEESFTNKLISLLDKGSGYGIHFIISTEKTGLIKHIEKSIKKFGIKIGTIGCDIYEIVDRSGLQNQNIYENTIALSYGNNIISKFRPYRYEENESDDQRWLEQVINKINDFKEENK